VSGARDSSSTVIIDPCSTSFRRTFHDIAVEFFPVQVDVVECESGRHELSPQFPLPGMNQPPAFPDCRDEVNRRPPSSECIEANQDAALAQQRAREACANITQITTFQNNLRNEYSGHIMRWLTFMAIAAGVAFIPLLGGVAAVASLVFALGSLAAALRASRQASSLNDQLDDAEQAWNLARLRYTEVSVRVVQACCWWQRGEIETNMQCHHPPPWRGSLATGKIGKPGG
jgi:hypothetical protein